MNAAAPVVRLALPSNGKRKGKTMKLALPTIRLKSKSEPKDGSYRRRFLVLPRLVTWRDGRRVVAWGPVERRWSRQKGYRWVYRNRGEA